MKKTRTAMLCLALATQTLQAQGPNDSGTYYRSADGKSGPELKTAMHTILKNLSTTSYSGLKEAYKKTDVRADGYLRDWYSNATKYTPGSAFASTGAEGQGYNREHTIPQSWFEEATPMKSDIVHVVPTDAAINGMRSDYPFGEVDTNNKSKYKESKNGYSKLGYSRTPGYSGLVFEPNDEIKGDLARIYFYMATCYEDKIASWTKAGGATVIQGDSYQPYAQWTLDMLMKWSQQDPVDDVEKARNNAAYNVQKNRNPFVDYPGLEHYIWGEKKETAFSYDNYEAGGTDVSERVAQPTFSPRGGTFSGQVTVSISTETHGAAIYYTTDGTDPSTTSSRYSSPLTLTESTTLKAIAAKEHLRTSSMATATYTIKASHNDGDTEEMDIALNNSLFGTSFTGTVAAGGTFTGNKDNITVTYDKGSSANQYISDTQIRLYDGNTLTISSTEGVIEEIAFTQVGGKGDKTLLASEGSVGGMNWTGRSQNVVFSVNQGSGHIQLAQMKLKTAYTSAKPKRGDTNGDGTVDVADIATIISIMAGDPEREKSTADVNGDGQADVADIAAVISVMAGNIQ